MNPRRALRNILCVIKYLVATIKRAKHKRKKVLDHIGCPTCCSNDTLSEALPLDEAVINCSPQVIEESVLDSDCNVHTDNDEFDAYLTHPALVSIKSSPTRNYMKQRNLEYFDVAKIHTHKNIGYQTLVDSYKTKLDTITKLVQGDILGLKHRCKIILAFIEIYALLLLSHEHKENRGIRDHFLSVFGPYAVLRVMKHENHLDNEEIQCWGCSVLRLSFLGIDSDSIIRKWAVNPDSSILSELLCLDDCIWTIATSMKNFPASQCQQADGCSVLYSLLHHYWLLFLKAQYIGIKISEVPSSELEALRVATQALKRFTFDCDIQKWAINILWFTMRHGYNKDQLIDWEIIPLLIMILDETCTPSENSRRPGNLPIELERRIRLTVNYLEYIQNTRLSVDEMTVCESLYDVDDFSDDFTAF
jgi:hypothetical protein